MKEAFLLFAVILYVGCSASPTDESGTQQQSSSSASSSSFTTSGAESGGVGSSTSSTGQSTQDSAGSANAAFPQGQNSGQGYQGSGGVKVDGQDDDEDSKSGHSRSVLSYPEALLFPQNHQGHHVCIPDYLAFGLFSKVAAAAGSALNFLPFHHISNHKLRDVMYLNALMKLFPSHGGNIHFPAAVKPFQHLQGFVGAGHGI